MFDEYTKKDIKKSPKEKSKEVVYLEDGFWRFDGAPIGYATKNSWQERIEICQVCDKFNKTWKICKECKCFMPLKTKIRWAACPLNKWT
jgi:hypothetical protein